VSPRAPRRSLPPQSPSQSPTWCHTQADTDRISFHTLHA
jgi:hypothetical protein